MDKMIVDSRGDVVITNDGATILKTLQVQHPSAKMLVELSASQDVEAGDGTTSVVVIAGALMGAALSLLERGIHPRIISDAYQTAVTEAESILESMSIPIELTDRDKILDAAITSLSSKVVSQYSSVIAPIAVDAVLRVIDPETAVNVDLSDIRVVKSLGGTIDDSELVEGLVFNQRASKVAGGPSNVKDAKIALIQFHLSPPKTDVENNVIVTDYKQIDRILKEERKYILDLCKTIKASGANVVLIQKSILRDAVNDMALHFLAKMKIMVVRDIERDEIEFISKTLGCQPCSYPDSLTEDKLGYAELVEEISNSTGGKMVKVTGVQNPGKTVTIVCRGSNKLVLDEAERSIHDALCVVRCLVKKKFLIAGGGAAETELAVQLGAFAASHSGVESYCIKAFADSLEIVPSTLAENAGLHPIEIVTELRKQHFEAGDSVEEKSWGLDVKKGKIGNMLEKNVIQPLLVTLSAITLATETVRMILKIDDIVAVR
eukprot:TRINITY_DN2747_c0_g1_i3.p1 TRINITY_DN2747_c0_g1~~TRINITY_DN2747_c0_g1_i3.p1  ORF type:complete len:491 (-),score=175.93 TRINITY_DN2747_c0_g1_i3:76-1548(-)